MFGTLGGQEIIFILVLALIVFGPRKLPEIGKSIGRMMAEFRKASNDFRRTLEDEVEAEKLRPVEPPAAVEPPQRRPAAAAGSRAGAVEPAATDRPATLGTADRRRAGAGGRRAGCRRDARPRADRGRGPSPRASGGPTAARPSKEPYP